MEPEIFLEMWSAASEKNSGKQNDKLELAEKFIAIYDAHGDVDMLHSIRGEDPILDTALAEYFEEDDEI